NFDIIDINTVISGRFPGQHRDFDPQILELKESILSITGLSADDFNLETGAVETVPDNTGEGAGGDSDRGEPAECYCISMIRSRI
ncbi:MAG: hypothetical protein GY940_17855, partial [bacterium]|nr:hypothetical protein [bacterium]